MLMGRDLLFRHTYHSCWLLSFSERACAWASLNGRNLHHLAALVLACVLPLSLSQGSPSVLACSSLGALVGLAVLVVLAVIRRCANC